MNAALRKAAAVPTFPTRLFGPIEISPNSIIVFPDGIPGFPDAQQFALLPAAAPALSWLQSLDEPALAFLLVKWNAIAAPIEAGGAAVFAIVTLPGRDPHSTANLQAPVVIDLGSRKGHQMIRTDETPGTAVVIDLEGLVRARS